MDRGDVWDDIRGVEEGKKKKSKSAAGGSACGTRAAKWEVVPNRIIYTCVYVYVFSTYMCAGGVKFPS